MSLLVGDADEDEFDEVSISELLFALPMKDRPFCG